MPDRAALLLALLCLAAPAIAGEDAVGPADAKRLEHLVLQDCEIGRAAWRERV